MADKDAYGKHANNICKLKSLSNFADWNPAGCRVYAVNALRYMVKEAKRECGKSVTIGTFYEARAKVQTEGYWGPLHEPGTISLTKAECIVGAAMREGFPDAEYVHAHRGGIDGDAVKKEFFHFVYEIYGRSL